MPIEIEKKYRLTQVQAEHLSKALQSAAAKFEGLETEVNTLYRGGALDPRRHVLRLRRVGGHAFLTYKERDASRLAIKQHREEETGLDDADACAAILEALGLRPSLVYEKRRSTWSLLGAEVVIDELPFGLFAEIEGDVETIGRIETLLSMDDFVAEHSTYPELAARHGEKVGEVIQARFR